MIIPIRCFSCGKPLAQMWEEFQAKLDKGEPVKKVFESLGVERYCCRGVFISHLELIDEAGQFKKS